MNSWRQEGDLSGAQVAPSLMPKGSHKEVLGPPGPTPGNCCLQSPQVEPARNALHATGYVLEAVKPGTESEKTCHRLQRAPESSNPSEGQCCGRGEKEKPAPGNCPFRVYIIPRWHEIMPYFPPHPSTITQDLSPGSTP